MLNGCGTVLIWGFSDGLSIKQMESRLELQSSLTGNVRPTGQKNSMASIKFKMKDCLLGLPVYLIYVTYFMYL